MKIQTLFDVQAVVTIPVIISVTRHAHRGCLAPVVHLACRFPRTSLAGVLLHPTSMAGLIYRPYSGENDLRHVMSLVQSELSEPYVIYTFRYFLQEW